MNVWATNILVYAKEGLDDMISETLDINNSDTNVNTYQETDAIYGPFQLPIHYVDKETLHELSPIVTEDLELVESKGKTSVYEQLFQPTHVLGQHMIQEWKNHFSSNEQYLLDTQQVILKINTLPDYQFDTDQLLSIYKELKINNDYFLEKYGYIEWDLLKILLCFLPKFWLLNFLIFPEDLMSRHWFWLLVLELLF